ncbi:MAG: undecaprenyl-phosphate alpha-N-acetylglucosaminyl 1-phosphate transferase [Planctomycetota bacterium]|nr:MAG: undecaprenyl-phosphate alpha-N-acetylglucosaminyl 1-phosphate transferase [Planctomycetota bacterium]
MSSHWVTNALWYALAFSTALGLALYVTPLTIRLARKFGIVDAPDGNLKQHARPTPYLGGLAVASAFVITFGLLSSAGDGTYDQGMGILASGFMVLLLGLYDDLVDLGPGVKFMGQALAAVVLYKAGVQTAIADLPEWANLALTVLWVTGVANAFNLIDILDGLATGTALVATLFLFVIAVRVEDAQLVPFMAITMAGALAGFLRFNWRPARIFLGDTGSLFVGFMLGALSMLVSYSEVNRGAIVAPLVLFAVPLFETVFVVSARTRRGLAPFRGSPHHFPLRLIQLGLPTVVVVRCILAAAVALGLLTLALVFGPEQAPLWVLSGVGLSGLLAAWMFARLPAPGDPQRHRNGSDSRAQAESSESTL